jgi:WD40-like Beta Propeller Repeat
MLPGLACSSGTARRAARDIGRSRSSFIPSAPPLRTILSFPSGWSPLYGGRSPSPLPRRTRLGVRGHGLVGSDPSVDSFARFAPTTSSAGNRRSDVPLLVSRRPFSPTHSSIESRSAAVRRSIKRSIVAVFGLRMERDGRLSPNGRWLAFTSNESGAWEVRVDGEPGAVGPLWTSSAGW